MSFLERVVAERRADAAAAREHRSPREAQPRAVPDPGTVGDDVFTQALRRRRQAGRLAVIAEVKRISPADGPLAAGVDPAAQARRYVADAEGGATAISVLTEPRHWGGSLADLKAVRAAVSVPVLCKDVIVDEHQIAEARAAGADAVLLIAEALTDAELRRFVALARELGMGALVEAHEPAAFGRAVASGAAVVGANARDLREPGVIDRGRARLLAPLVGAEQIFVAESGIASAEDARLLPARVDAVLVGTALMRAADPAPLIRALASIDRVVPAVGAR
ncbi:MAG TPA: indole-3-glycerol-phosphate synthase [Candidatus Limnocylindria bacterium]|nr:indole-3-glycerol-phosphate synthase [Candidatus Limnocylindria bacterium]